jgi:Rod binding domain-containing protein
MDPAATIDLTQQTARYAQAPVVKGTSDPAKAREAAESFEAFFIGQYIEHMFAGISTDGMFKGGQGEKVFHSLLMQEYGNAIAKSGGIGIADTVQKAILQMQEKAQSGPQQQEPAQ